MEEEHPLSWPARTPGRAATADREPGEPGAAFRALVEQVSDGVAVVDAAGAGQLVLANARLAAMTGYTRAELLSMRVADLLVAGEPVPWAPSASSPGAGHDAPARRHLRRKDGSRVACEVSTRRAGDSRVQIVLREAPGRAPEDAPHPDAARLEALGLVAAAVAHDFNNFLLAIQASGDMAIHALREQRSPDVALAELAEIGSAARRAATLSRQLLAFGRRRTAGAESFPLIDAVTGIEPMLRLLLRPAASLELRDRSDGRRVTADVGQMEQVVMNLVLNAREAMPAGGRVEIEVTTRRTPAGSGGGGGDRAIPSGDHVVLAVSDAGTGMARETAARAFDPLFTTKPAGTGLGLWTVREIVARAGGHVTVESAPGAGSRFEVWLPEAAKPRGTPWTGRGPAAGAAAGR